MTKKKHREEIVHEVFPAEPTPVVVTEKEATMTKKKHHEEIHEAATVVPEPAPVVATGEDTLALALEAFKEVCPAWDPASIKALERFEESLRGKLK